MTLLKRPFLKFLCLLVLAGCASSTKTSSSLNSSLEKCKALLQKEERNQAGECFRPLSDAGNAEAQFYLGDLYLNAEAGAQSDQYAEKLYRLSANQGFSKGQKALGDLYFTGYVVAKDVRLAIAWYEKAAAQKNVEALNKLGSIFEDGSGVPRDRAKSLHWYTEAANQGDVSSVEYLANIYYTAEKNFVEARQWGEKAAAVGDRNSRLWLALMNQNGLGGAKNNVEALKWYLLFQDLKRPDPLGRPEKFIKGSSATALKKAQELADEWRKSHPPKKDLSE